MMTVDDLLNHAIDEASKLNYPRIFLVKDLFDEKVWNKIPVEDRLVLGHMFYAYVENEPTNRYTPLKKTDHSQQIYKVVEKIFK